MIVHLTFRAIDGDRRRRHREFDGSANSPIIRRLSSRNGAVLTPQKSADGLH